MGGSVVPHVIVKNGPRLPVVVAVSARACVRERGGVVNGSSHGHCQSGDEVAQYAETGLLAFHRRLRVPLLSVSVIQSISDPAGLRALLD